MNNTLTPEQALFLRDFLLPAIEDEAKTTTRVLAAIADDKAEYRPDPKSRTAGELAWHIVINEIVFLDGIANGEFPAAEADPPNTTQNIAELLEFYEESFNDGLARVRQLTAEQLAKPINFFGVFNLPAVQYLSFLHSHTIHHRGQLSAYLRPMGAKVPAIYGPSGDEMWGSGEAASA